MSIIATAPVPVNGNLRKVGTFAYPTLNPGTDSTPTDPESVAARLAELERQIEEHDEEYERGWVDGAVRATSALTHGDLRDELATLAAALRAKLAETGQVGQPQLVGLAAQVERLTETVAQVATAEQIVRQATKPADPEAQLREALLNFYSSQASAEAEAEVDQGGQEHEPLTPCPTWCTKHTVGTPGFPADRTTSHEAVRTTIATSFRSRPFDPTVDRHEVEVWAERFDSDRDEDGHPSVGLPAVHLSVDGYDSTGMTAEQAEQIGQALLASAAAIRAADSTDEWAGAEQYAAATIHDSKLDQGAKQKALAVLRLVPREVVEAAADELAEPPTNGSRVETETAATPSWQATPCPTWCIADHEELEDPGERYHAGPLSEDTELPLSLLKPVEWGTRQWGPSVLRLDLEQEHREVAPRVRALINDSGHVFDLTVGEARKVAALLIHLADLADQDNPNRSPRAA